VTHQLEELERISADPSTFTAQNARSNWYGKKKDGGRDDGEEVLLKRKCEVEVIATAIYNWAKDAIHRW
jgi:hypothetical protein